MLNQDYQSLDDRIKAEIVNGYRHESEITQDLEPFVVRASET